MWIPTLEDAIQLEASARCLPRPSDAGTPGTRAYPGAGVFCVRDRPGYGYLACCLGGEGSPIRPFARPPNWPEAFENHRKTAKTS